MTPTEKTALEKRIDELCQENERLRERIKASDDGRMRQADNLIDKCHRIARLQGENAKLREENERLRSVVSDGADNAREVLDENAKLRELASILCFCMQVHTQCDDCKLNGAKGELAYDPLCACDGLHEILRELGIEVPS